LEIGNTSLRTSNFGSPITSGPTGVTLDYQGKISIGQYATKAGAVANFSSAADNINPYTAASGGAGLPSGQKLYLAEAAALGPGLPVKAPTACPLSSEIFKLSFGADPPAPFAVPNQSGRM
jgi:hypothetical protein